MSTAGPPQGASAPWGGSEPRAAGSVVADLSTAGLYPGASAHVAGRSGAARALSAMEAIAP
jgi:hypothetical protein